MGTCRLRSHITRLCQISLSPHRLCSDAVLVVQLQNLEHWPEAIILDGSDVWLEAVEGQEGEAAKIVTVEGFDTSGGYSVVLNHDVEELVACRPLHALGYLSTPDGHACMRAWRNLQQMAIMSSSSFKQHNLVDTRLGAVRCPSFIATRRQKHVYMHMDAIQQLQCIATRARSGGTCPSSESGCKGTRSKRRLSLSLPSVQYPTTHQIAGGKGSVPR
jgi:hypothetical protein